MIKTLIINNYKGIENFKLDLEKINLLYGRNSVGKTRILNFIFDFFNFSTSHLDGQVIFVDPKTKKIIDIYLKIKDKKISKFIIKSDYNKKKKVKILDLEQVSLSEPLNEFKYQPNKNNLINYIKSLKLESNLDFEILKKYFEIEYYLEKDKDLLPINYNIDFNQKKISINEKEVEHYLNSETKKNTCTYEEKENILKLQKYLNEFIKKIDNNFLTLEYEFDNIIDDFKDENKLFYLKKVNYKLKNNVKFDLKNQMQKTNVSRGVRHFIYVFEKIVKLITSECNILIIDEFDSYIHDELYTKLIDFLVNFVEKNIDKQVISITHNTSSMYNINRKYITIIDYNEQNELKALKIKGSFLNTKSNIEKLYRENILSNQYIYDSDFEFFLRDIND